MTYLDYDVSTSSLSKFLVVTTDMSRFQRFLRQLWTSDAHIPFTRITYRPHIVLVAFGLLAVLALFPDPPRTVPCGDSMAFIHRYCSTYKTRNFSTESECLKPYIDEIGTCCDLGSLCTTLGAPGFNELDCQVEACYHYVYRPTIKDRTATMLFVVFLGVLFAFSRRPSDEKRETASV